MTNQQKKVMMIALFILVVLAIMQYFFTKKNPKTYPDFNVNLPSGYTVHGIDISRYQQVVDWHLVCDMRDKGAQLDFVIIKATEGTSLVDKQLDDNWHDSRKTRLIRGVYHYFHANKSGTDQANFFIKHIDLQSRNLAPVIDIEETQGVSNAVLQKRLLECLQILQDKYDVKPIIYCNVDFYKRHLGKDFDSYPLWAAHYHVTKPTIDRDWQIWQHSDAGNVNGIDGKVDFNTVNGGLLTLKALCIQ
jgi:lysozyme